ncbi:MAG TPA: DNA primase [Tepidisphaeraceae bacterium]|nr:DNA primase [Tepidisphaeraceae bacterium]
MPVAGDDFRSQVLAATDIVELIGRSVALKRRGKDYVGLCPFHQEKTPSFTVSPSKQIFYCYGCKAGGSVFDFVMKRDRIEFPDALRLLGEQAGIEMPRMGVSKQKAGEKRALYDIQSTACAFFEKLLAHPQQGAAAREYLATRQINDESIKRFQIGYAADAWDALLRSPVSRKYPAPLLVQGGLLKERQQGTGYYDTFRNRLMFPIRDENGRVIAFGGRVMPGSQDPAKYLNSPETPLFSKSRCIFGLDLARQKMVETRTAVVVEGYTDVIVAHQFGVSNVVSVLGTAMTEQHVTMLRRFADRIVLLFDADTAGDVAVDRTVGLFLTQPVEIAIASMPQGVDPDEYLLKEGAQAFQNLLDGAADALSYKWKQLARHFDENGGDLTGQQRAIEAYLDVLASARGSGPVDAIRWGQALARVSRLTDIPVDELNRRFKTRKPARNPGPAAVVEQKPDPAASQSTGPATARDRAERWILGILLLQPERWRQTQQIVHVEDFAHEGHRRLAEMYWNHQRDEGEPVLSEFLGALRDPILVELAVIAVDEVEALDDPDRTLAEAVHHLQNERRLKEEKKLVAALRRTSDERQGQDELELLRELQEKVRKPDLRRV